MTILFSLALLLFPQTSFAHGGHEHEAEMKAEAPLPGLSVFKLDSKWKNQKGEEVKLSDLRGRPRVVAMLFTRCETACPLIVEDLKKIAEEAGAKKKSPVEVSIFSLDSFRETPESLAAFATKRKLPAHWGLFTSNADAVAELAAALGIRYKRLPDGDFIHSNVIFLLNADGEIAARKEGLKTPREDFVRRVEKGL